MNKLKTIENYMISATIFLVPIIFLNLFPNQFITAKLIILSLGIILILIVKSIYTIYKGSLTLYLGQFDSVILLLLVSIIVSAVVKTPNKLEAFFLPGTATILTLSILFYFLTNQIDSVSKKSFNSLLLFSGSLVSICSILSLTKIFSLIPGVPEFMKTTTFNPLGGNLPTAIFLATLLPFGVEVIISEKRKSLERIILSACSLLIVFGLTVNIYNLLPGKPGFVQLPDFNTSWSIAIDSLKASPILGIGQGNYLTAFNLYRPISFNQTEYWMAKSNTSRDFYLTFLTESGLLGASILIILIYSLYKNTEKEFSEGKNLEFLNKPETLSLIILSVIFIFFPATITNLFLFFILISLNSKTKKADFDLSVKTEGLESGLFKARAASRFPAIMVSLPILALAGAFGFFAAKITYAEYLFGQSLQALAKNDGAKTYNLMRQAILLAPTVDRYRLSFAQVNFAIANNMAANKDLTDSDKQNISQLVQQSVAEAKAAVTLNLQRAGNWEVLASTYKAIIPLTQGADQFAIQTYSQAIALDPMNPDLRISLGGIYYSLKDYENAIDSFKLAVLTKQNYANAHYNLALAYAENRNFDKAVSEMTTTLSLLDKSSKDYELAKTELENLEKLKGETAKETNSQGETLTPPQKAEEPKIKPPIKLPEEAQPPKVVPTPEPQPTETPGP